jgi:hypothetical protein
MINTSKKILSLFFIFTLVISDAAFATSLVGTPTGNHRETSPFGWRESTNSNHLGVDYGANSAGTAGDSTYSTISGTVVESRYQTNSTGSGGWGNTVLIESSSGNYRVRYSHLDQPGLASGTTVNPGDTVGAMGGTGRNGGYAVHLDYAVYVRNPATGEFQAVDPNVAAGLDLDDPAVAAMLIADAESKIAGELRNEGAPQGGAGGEVTVDDSGGSDAAPLGCDPAVLEQNETIVDAMNERDMQVAKSMITQPASIAQTTCTDQHIQTQSAAGGILSNLPGGNISETMGPLIEQPFIQNLTSNFMSANPLGSLQSMINNSYTQVVEEFNTMMSGLSGGLLGGLGGGAGASGGCDMMNESWLLSQCIQMPKFPSVNDILNGALENVTGAVTDLINSPFKALDQVCQGMSDKLGDFSSKAENIFEDAVNSATSPITDTLGEATDNITGIGN